MSHKQIRAHVRWMIKTGVVKDSIGSFIEYIIDKFEISIEIEPLRLLNAYYSNSDKFCVDVCLLNEFGFDEIKTKEQWISLFREYEFVFRSDYIIHQDIPHMTIESFKMLLLMIDDRHLKHKKDLTFAISFSFMVS